MRKNSEDRSAHYNLFLTKIANSGLNEIDAKSLGITCESRQDQAFPQLTQDVHMRLAYYDHKGKPTNFYRLRLLVQPRSFAAERKKDSRYLQPPGTGCHAYFPRVVDWSGIVKNPNTPVLITEGE